MFNKKSHLLIFGKGFNYSEDGPGNRLIYHLKGCNLHCPWCSNPDGLKSEEYEKGTPVDELLKEILSCKPMFFDGGGVTFTGGEILCQADAMENILFQLTENKIHTAVETNASLPSLKRLMPYIDYLIADFKHPNEKKLMQVVGASLLPIKDNLKTRVLSGKPLLVRVPLIHGFNDNDEALEGFTEFFRELSELGAKDSLWFELLKYHEYGREKWEKEGLPYTVKNGFISDKRYNEIMEFFRLRGIAAINT
ncbi:MAG: Pyruvate formate-lyase-activating enzyme [Firmicutes bacterium ADurb.Bin300]|nr:MAG: Pyruvate formate-lyase-activating enzyme [Firmicutes bacterium ADurb.Bin300]